MLAGTGNGAMASWFHSEPQWRGAYDLRRLGHMSDASDKTAPRAGLSFSARAAWYSVIVPLITPVVWFIVLAGSNGYLILASTVASCLLGTSSLAAVASLIRGHERRRYVWIALIGLALSAVLGFFSLVFRSMPIC